MSGGMLFFFSSRRRHTRCSRDWSSDVCSSDLECLSSTITDQAQTPRRLRLDQNARSEEHTSELQSRLHLVCRLLLEKKKKIIARSFQTQSTRHTVDYHSAIQSSTHVAYSTPFV